MMLITQSFSHAPSDPLRQEGCWAHRLGLGPLLGLGLRRLLYLVFITRGSRQAEVSLEDWQESGATKGRLVRVPLGVWAQRRAVYSFGSPIGEFGEGRVPEGVPWGWSGRAKGSICPQGPSAWDTNPWRAKHHLKRIFWRRELCFQA